MSERGRFAGLDDALTAYEKIARERVKDDLAGPVARLMLWPEMTDEQAEKIRAWCDTAPFSHLMDAVGAPR